MSAPAAAANRSRGFDYEAIVAESNRPERNRYRGFDFAEIVAGALIRSPGKRKRPGHKPPRVVRPVSEENLKMYQDFIEGKSVPSGALDPTINRRQKDFVDRRRILFDDKIKSLGGCVIGYYKSSSEGVLCQCRNGHMCFPSWQHLRDSTFIGCSTCNQRDPNTTEELFFAKMKELGVTVIGKWVNCSTRVAVKCKYGHLCNILWTSGKNGGVCLACFRIKNATTVQESSKVAQSKFIARVSELGGKVIGTYKKNDVGVECICKNNHRCWPTWNTLDGGCGMCRRCSGMDPEIAKQKLIAKINELGAQLIGTYRGSKWPIQALCSKGHDCVTTWAALQQGIGICRICSGTDPKIAEERFRTLVARQGGTILGVYKNSTSRVEVKCSKGHLCYPLTGNVMYKCAGICRLCEESNGERRVREILASLNVKMDGQYILSSLLNRFYDFGNSTCIIEFDGLQHFAEVLFFKPLTLAQRQVIDRIKTKAALAAGRKVIRIHWTFLREDDAAQEEFLQAALASDKPLLAYKPSAYGWLGVTVHEPTWSGQETKP